MAKKNPQAPTAPSAPEMKPAWEAYQRGDQRGARKQAKALLAGNPSEPVRREALELIRRTNLDPAVKLTLAVMALTVVGIIIALALR